MLKIAGNLRRAAWCTVCTTFECSGHVTRDRYERFRERNHLDESGD
jgi:hypothetical protein